MSILSVYYVYHMHAWCPQRPKEGIKSRTGVVDGCELPSGCWEPNSGPLQEQQESVDTQS